MNYGCLHFTGKVDFDEMIVAFTELGIQVDNTEALKLFNR